MANECFEKGFGIQNSSSRRDEIRQELISKYIDNARSYIGPRKNGNEFSDNYLHDKSLRGLDWCDTFADSMLIKTVEDKVLAGKMIGSLGSYTEDSRNKFKHNQLWHDANSDYTPKPGDQIFFKIVNQRHPEKSRDRIVNHVGIVTKVENGRVYTIEGNTSNPDKRGEIGVFEKSYPLDGSKQNNSKRIVGYGTPDWDMAADKILERENSMGSRFKNMNHQPSEQDLKQQQPEQKNQQELEECLPNNKSSNDMER